MYLHNIFTVHLFIVKTCFRVYVFKINNKISNKQIINYRYFDNSHPMKNIMDFIVCIICFNI